MNWEEAASRWEHLTGSATENWARLTDHDLEEISGKREQLSGKIQELHGIYGKPRSKCGTGARV